MAKADKIQIAKTITLTATGNGGTRGLRDFQEELQSLLAKGATIEAAQPGCGSFKVTLRKYEDWTLDELMVDVAKAVG